MTAEGRRAEKTLFGEGGDLVDLRSVEMEVVGESSRDAGGLGFLFLRQPSVRVREKHGARSADHAFLPTDWLTLSTEAAGIEARLGSFKVSGMIWIFRLE